MFNIEKCSPVCHDAQENSTPHAFELALHQYNHNPKVATIHDLIEPLVQLRQLLVYFEKNENFQLKITNIINFFNQCHEIIIHINIEFDKADALREINRLISNIQRILALFPALEQSITPSIAPFLAQIKQQRASYDAIMSVLKQNDALWEQIQNHEKNKTRVINYFQKNFRLFIKQIKEYPFDSISQGTTDIYLPPELLQLFLSLFNEFCVFYQQQTKDNPAVCLPIFIKNQKEVYKDIFTIKEHQYKRAHDLAVYLFNTFQRSEQLQVVAVKCCSVGATLDDLLLHMQQFVTEQNLIKNKIIDVEQPTSDVMDTMDSLSDNESVDVHPLLVNDPNAMCFKLEKELLMQYFQQNDNQNCDDGKTRALVKNNVMYHFNQLGQVLKNKNIALTLYYNYLNQTIHSDIETQLDAIWDFVEEKLNDIHTTQADYEHIFDTLNDIQRLLKERPVVVHNELAIISKKMQCLQRQFRAGVDYPASLNRAEKKMFDNLNSMQADADDFNQVIKYIIRNIHRMAPFQAVYLPKLKQHLNALTCSQAQLTTFQETIARTIFDQHFQPLIIEQQVKINEAIYQCEINKIHALEQELATKKQQALHLFWQLMECSEIPYKKREQTYVELCLEKLIALNHNTNSTIFLNNSIKIWQDFHHQINTSKSSMHVFDSKTFLINLQRYLNKQINQHATVKNNIPKYADLSKDNLIDPMTYLRLFKNILKNNNKVFLFTVNFYKDQQQFFTYFSWRDHEKQTEIAKLYEEISLSLNQLREKLKHRHSSIMNTFDEFTYLLDKRFNDNQIKEALDTLQYENNTQLALNKQALKDKVKSNLPNIIATATINTSDNLVYQSQTEEDMVLSDSQVILEQTLTRFLKARLLVEHISQLTYKENLEPTMRNLAALFDNQEQNNVELILLIETVLLPKIVLFESTADQEQAFLSIQVFKRHLLTQMPQFNALQLKTQYVLLQTPVDDWQTNINSFYINNFYIHLLHYFGYDFKKCIAQFKQLRTLTNHDHLPVLEQLNFEPIIRTGLCELDVDLDALLRDFETNVQEIALEQDNVAFYGCFTAICDDLNEIIVLKKQLQTLNMFVHQADLYVFIDLLEEKIFSNQICKYTMVELVDLFDLIINYPSKQTAFAILHQHDNPLEWQYKLYSAKINNTLDQLETIAAQSIEKNHYDAESNELDGLIEVDWQNNTKEAVRLKKQINTVLHQFAERYTCIKDKTYLFKFIAYQLNLELKQSSVNCQVLAELNAVFQLMQNAAISDEIVRNLQELESIPVLEEACENNPLLKQIVFGRLISLKPFLYRLSLNVALHFDFKTQDADQKDVIYRLEKIKEIYSEALVNQLINLMNAQKQTIVPYHFLELLRCAAEKTWLLDENILLQLKQQPMDSWAVSLQTYTDNQRKQARKLDDLIQLMKKEQAGVNRSLSTLLDTQLKQDIEQIHHAIATAYATWNEQDIHTWAKSFKGNRLLSHKHEVVQAIAVVSQAMYLFEGYYPRDVQLIALWLFLNPEINQSCGRLGQIATGEGKSLIVAALAAVKALGCQRVDIVTSSNVLASRDAEKYKPFFKIFDLETSNNCDEACEYGEGALSAEQVRQQRYYANGRAIDIIYGEAGCFERDILLTEFNQTDPEQNIIGPRMANDAIASVIIDEVDSMLLDKANMVLYLSHNMNTLKTLERVLVAIWQVVNHDSLDDAVVNDDLVSYVSTLILQQIESGAIEIPKYNVDECHYMDMKLFVNRRMPIWVKSAFHVKQMSPNDSYIVTQNLADKNDYTITVMDKETGTEQASTRWSNGVHQFLQLKHTRRLSPETLKAVFISNMNYFKRYGKNLCGLTGSLGSKMEQETLNKVFNVNFFELPRFKAELFIQLPGQVLKSKDEWCQEIEHSVQTQIDKKRAVLIICDNINDVLMLQTYLSNNHPNTHAYYSSYTEFAIQQLMPGDIIVATNLAGRGTDLETSEQLEKNGGLHVITAYMPSNVRIEVQAFGRTGRKGNKGSGAFVVHDAYGLSIDELKQLRDVQEKERLTHFISHDLERIKIEEKLLQKFVQLYHQVEKELTQENDNFYIQSQLYSLKNRWAFWLDAMTESFNMVHVLGDHAILEKFDAFEAHVRQDMQKSFKLIKEPAEWMKLADYYREKESWSHAISCYEQAIKDPLYASAEYYLAACRLNRENKNFENKKQFKTSLKKVSLAIEKEMQFLMQAGQLAFHIGEKNRQSGAAGYGNEYDKQLKEKAEIWNIFVGNINNALGNELTVDILKSNKYLNAENAQALLKTLEDKQYVKAPRVSKKYDLEKLQLPGLFNQPQFREPIIALLKLKRANRNAAMSDWRLDVDAFEAEVTMKKIILPYLGSFLSEMQKHGFITSTLENEYQLVHHKIFKQSTSTHENIDYKPYMYKTHEEMELHYTETFKSCSFASVLLKAAVYTCDVDDETFLTLKDKLTENDFAILKTKEEAVRYLWGFLKTEHVIKGNKVIGFAGSDAVAERIEQIKTVVQTFIEEKKLNQDGVLEEAIDTVLGGITQTIGQLKKLPDNKTMVTFLDIQKTYYLDNNKLVPGGLKEFIDLSFGILFSLQQTPPHWYEIAAVVAIGMAQIIAGVLIKTFVPVAGQVLGDFLINTGCDDLFFAVECAIKGEFSWDKYWEHKQQSMITSAIMSVTMGGVSFLKNAKKLHSFKEAYKFQKLTHADKLRKAGQGLSKTVKVSHYIGKEIGRNVVQTGLSAFASVGVDKLMEQVSSLYEVALDKQIAESLDAKFSKIVLRMDELVAINYQQGIVYIDDCIQRRLEHLPEHKMLREISKYAGPAAQGVMQACKGKSFGALKHLAVSLADIGISAHELYGFVEEFTIQLENDLYDAVQRLKENTAKSELTETEKKQYQVFKSEKKRLITKQIQTVFKQKLNQTIAGPVLKLMANSCINAATEKMLPTDRVEQVANSFEMSHALNFAETTKPKYLDKFSIFKAEARPVSSVHLEKLQGHEHEIYPKNAPDVSLAQIKAAWGNQVGLFINNQGELFIKRPSLKMFCHAIVHGNKPAGVYEQAMIATILDTSITMTHESATIQQYVLQNANGLPIEFIIQKNPGNVGHALLQINDQLIDLSTNHYKQNDCYYTIAQVAYHMSNGKNIAEAQMAVTPAHNADLRKKVADGIRRAPDIKQQIRTASQQDKQAHFSALAGSKQYNAKAQRRACIHDLTDTPSTKRARKERAESVSGNEPQDDRLSRAVERATHPERVKFLDHVFNHCLSFNENEHAKTLSLKNIDAGNENINFHHVLEACAMHLDLTTKSIYFQFKLHDQLISFQLAKDSRPNASQQMVIKCDGKAPAYADLSFVKHANKYDHREIASLMLSVLRAPIHEVPQLLQKLPSDALHVDILKFLIITHTAENYRQAQHGPLKPHDLTQKSLKHYDVFKPHDTASILSRTPGVGKSTRGFLELVSSGEANFSLQNLNEHLVFSNKGGADLQRQSALGVRNFLDPEQRVYDNMSLSSDALFAANMEKALNQNYSSFDVLLGSHQFNFDIKKQGNTYEGILSFPDIDPDTPLTQKHLDQWKQNIIHAYQKNGIDLTIDQRFELNFPSYANRGFKM